MNRSDFLTLDRERTVRRITAPYTLRASETDENLLVWEGYSATTEQPYELYGGPPYGWVETMAAGAFKKTLSEGADVAFKINHEGMTLARTKSGTMDLTEDDHGEHVVARLDRRMQPVADLAVASERGDIDEMSFAFRVVKDEWTDENGEPATWMDGTQRRILEVNQNKGDVAPVNYGANPTTSGGFRALEAALRNGELTDEQIATLRSLTGGQTRCTQTDELLASWLDRRLEFI